MLDVMAMLPSLIIYVQHHVPRGEAAKLWRRMLLSVQEREAPTRAGLAAAVQPHRRLAVRHASRGRRRHQWLAARPRQETTVVVGDEDADHLERELAPYAEALHRTMLRYTTEEPF